MKANKVLDSIKNYEAGKPIELVVREYGIDPDKIVKLASNENPAGTNPSVRKAIEENSHRAHLYPDDSMYELKEALAAKYGVSEKEVIIGAGSDQVLEFIARAFLNEESSVLMSQVTFAMYEIYARQMGAEIIRTPNYRHIADEFLDLYRKHRPKIVYLCTPNNPTGDFMKKEDVIEVIEGVSEDTIVVVDGAYMEYAAAMDAENAIGPQDILRYPNVIYLGTFSKAYGLGGMRVGYGIASEKLISVLMKLRPPFNITTLSLLAAIEALRDESFVKESIDLHRREIVRYEEFAKEHGIRYIESYTNFITYLFDEALDSSEIAQKLLEQGVIIRDLASYGLNAVRITVGTKEQNDILFDRLAGAIS